MTNNHNVSPGSLSFLATQRIDLTPDANHPVVDTSFLNTAPASPPMPVPFQQAVSATPLQPADIPQQAALMEQHVSERTPQPEPAVPQPEPAAPQPVEQVSSVSAERYVSERQVQQTLHPATAIPQPVAQVSPVEHPAPEAHGAIVLRATAPEKEESNIMPGQAEQEPIQSDGTPPAQAERQTKAKEARDSSSLRGGRLWMIGGIAVFGALLVGLFLSGALRRAHTAAPNVAVPDAVIESTAGQSQLSEGPTAQQQQAVKEEILRRLPDQLAQQGAQVNADSLFQAALQGAQCQEIAFENGSIHVTLQLPDPMKLQSMLIESYTPHSGAQAYIQRAYEDLLRKAGTMQDRVNYSFDIYYQMLSNGDITCDITMPMLSFPLYDYSAAYTPHMDQYMKELGFYTAAQEVLLPDFQNWDSHQGVDRESPMLDAYFDSLATALSDKGINFYNNVTVDPAQIKSALETRFKETWLCEGLEFKHDVSGYYLTLYYPNDFSYFNPVADKLTAQYRAGAMPAPGSVAELEAIFTQELRNQTNDMLTDSPKSRENMMLRGDYWFDWETLGKRGLTACPDLVESLRHFIDGYDFFVHDYAMVTDISD